MNVVAMAGEMNAWVQQHGFPPTKADLVAAPSNAQYAGSRHQS